jgi:DNA-binding response OmpR family regulator
MTTLARTDGITPLASAQYPTASVCDQGGPTQYAFEDYVLDAERRELTRGSEAVAVGPQVFDLMLYLVRNREHVVSKDDRPWPSRISL